MTDNPVLVGQYDSPFVRRTAIVLHQYGVVFERRTLSVFADFDAILQLTPLGKVPVFAPAGGAWLWDSRVILDYLHGEAPPGRLLLPIGQPERREVMRTEAIALGLAEKAYERGVEFSRRAPDKRDPAWVARLERQIGSALTWLEARRPTPFLHGSTIDVADVTAAVAFTYIQEKWPQLVPEGAFPTLERHCNACEALPAFQAARYSAAEAAQSGWRAETG